MFQMLEMFFNSFVLKTDGLRYFNELTRKFGYIRDLDSAIEVFFVLEFHQQVILSIMFFGVLVILYIFIVAALIDNEE